MKYFQILSYPLGFIGLEATSEALERVIFMDKIVGKIRQNPNFITNECAKQLELYFALKLRKFNCPLLLNGTQFQKNVWTKTMQIPYGQVWTYKRLSAEIGKTQAYRAVANALGQNPLPIIIPCHRVVRSDGSLGGYSSGIRIKRFLLELERGLNNLIQRK